MTGDQLASVILGGMFMLFVGFVVWVMMRHGGGVRDDYMTYRSETMTEERKP